MFDYRELKSQLSAIGYDGSHDDDAKINEVLLSIAVMFDEAELSDSQKKTILEIISYEGRKSLQNIPKKVLNQEWVDFNYGNVVLGDYVRVKKDAYDSKTGGKHNGLVGILTYMSGGRCTVKYIGLSSGSTMLHPKEKLESLKLV